MTQPFTELRPQSKQAGQQDKFTVFNWEDNEVCSHFFVVSFRNKSSTFPLEAGPGRREREAKEAARGEGWRVRRPARE